MNYLLIFWPLHEGPEVFLVKEPAANMQALIEKAPGDTKATRTLYDKRSDLAFEMNPSDQELSNVKLLNLYP